MKTNTITYCLLVMMLVSCHFTQGNKIHDTGEKQLSNQQTVSAPQLSTLSHSLITDSIGLSKKDSFIEATIAIDYPIEGNKPLVESLRKYIAQTLNVNIRQADNPDSLLKQAVERGYAEMKVDYDDMAEYLQGDVPSLAYNYKISRDWENDRYLSYVSSYYEYRGGAHGGSSIIGTTFRKDDGKRLGWDIYKNTDSPQFRQLIKEGIRSYFQDNGITLNDQELMDNLITDSDIDHLPLPEYPPYMVKEGMLFVYQQYEIAAYAMGMPSFIIPFDKLKPFITIEP